MGEKHLQSGGQGLTAAQRVQVAKCKEDPVPVSMHERVTRAGGDTRVWASAAAGGVHMTAAMVERAITGDLADPRTRTALMQLWRLFEKHAAEVGGGAGHAQRAS